VAAGTATVSNRDLNFTHQIHLIGLHIGVLIQHTPQMFSELMAELSALQTAGVFTPGEPTVVDLAHGPQAPARLESRAAVGKLALRP